MVAARRATGSCSPAYPHRWLHRSWHQHGAKRSHQESLTTKGDGVSRRPRARGAHDTVDVTRKRYSNATAERVLRTYRDLERIDDVVTISAIARRTGVSRSTVRAVLRQECAWTPAQSR